MSGMLPSPRKREADTMYYQEHEIRFQCTGCGRCCHGHPEYNYIEMKNREAERIRKHLKIKKADFYANYTELLPDKTMSLRLTDKGQCVLLDDNGHCSVYDYRPLQCQTYPFWPELILRKKDWVAESRRCEGIDQGPAVSLAYLEKQLQLQKKYSEEKES